MYNTPLKQFLMVCDNTGSQSIGYGTIDPVNKTSTTHSAITDQAGLSYINTENFKQAEVQSELCGGAPIPQSSISGTIPSK